MKRLLTRPLTTLIETIEAGIAAGGCAIEIVDTGGLTPSPA